MKAVRKDKAKLDEFIDEVVNSGTSADELLQEGGLLKELFKRVTASAASIRGSSASTSAIPAILPS